MLVHLRLTTPSDLTDELVGLLLEDARTTNLTLQRGAGLEPAGDVVTVDVAREATSDVIGRLTRTGLADRGGITVTASDATPFAGARRVEQAAQGSPDDAVIWDLVLERAESATRPSFSFQAFLVLATLLAAVAVITDSPVLVVGAMVVGPEFAVIAAICCGLALRRAELVRGGVLMLLASFALAIAVTALLGRLGLEAGLFTADAVSRPRPLTGFIWHPDRWSAVVALLAGAAGALALTTGRSEVMVGVFISVTTVPAAGNLALALAVGDRAELVGAGLQLALNLTCLVLACSTVLLLEHAFWSRVGTLGRARTHATR